MAKDQDKDSTSPGLLPFHYQPQQQQQQDGSGSSPPRAVVGELDQSPVEQVALTVPTVDDPSLPVWTFRMWVLGVASCLVLSFVNQFFGYRTEPLMVSAISAQIVTLPLGKLMAAVLPTRVFRVPFIGWKFSLNPGPFNVKEHVLITIFANAGSAFGSGTAYGVSIVDIIKALYKRNISLTAAFLLVITTQTLGYGFAGLLRKYLVDNPHMWWPGSLVQVQLFRTFHEPEEGKRISRLKFFLIILVCSFAYYSLPGFMFQMLTSLSWVCWAWPHSVIAQQIGSGMKGLGIGAIGLDWSAISSFLGSPLVTPWHAIANVFVGYCLFMYVVLPIVYWKDVFQAKTFPIYSSRLFTREGHPYPTTSIVNKQFELDQAAYHRVGPVRMSTFFAIVYGFNFATLAATLSHVGLFHGREIWQGFKASREVKPDIHTRLMRKYPDIPRWWFVVMLLVTLGVSIIVYQVYKTELQLPWWGLVFACAFAAIFTLPIGIIGATTNQFIGLNVITEYVMGLIIKGKPIANVSFKTYGYISMTQALSFLQDFKLGHYMKIPPRSMFATQLLGTLIAACVNVGVAWWLLTTVENICDVELLPPNSPWTCPGDRTFFSASVIWGLVGPMDIFVKGHYHVLNWFFLVGFLAPVPVWVASKLLPKSKWVHFINIPVLLGATRAMPPASSVNYTSWAAVGAIFSFYVFKYYKQWWTRYNYVLSAALDAGVAFMGVVLYFSLQMNDRNLNWWGNNLDNCPLASCPTAPGVNVTGCPIF